MPRARDTDVRLRVGTWPALVDVPAATYRIENLATWNDQHDETYALVPYGPVVVPWLAPVLLDPPEYDRVWIDGAGDAHGEGFLRWSWLFSYLTFEMFKQTVYDIWFPASIYSNLVTVVQPSRLQFPTEQEWFHATAYRPINNDQFHDYEPAPGGYENVRIRFGFGVKFVPV